MESKAPKGHTEHKTTVIDRAAASDVAQEGLKLDWTTNVECPATGNHAPVHITAAVKRKDENEGHDMHRALPNSLHNALGTKKPVNR